MKSVLVRNSGGPLLRWVVLAAAGLYFVGPLLAAISFTVKKPGGSFGFDAYTEIFAPPATGQIGFGEAVTFSLMLSAMTIIFTLALMVPTQILIHLHLPRLKPIVETICLLPLVFPAVVLVVGVSDIYRAAQPEGSSSGGVAFEVLKWIRDADHPFLLVALYTVMSLPFVYRAINAGLEAAPLATLVEASRNLGANWWTTVVSVLLPTLRTAMVNAAFLSFALAMGEYTVASILLFNKPFPVWLAQLPATSGQEQAAVSVFSLLLVEVTLLLVSGVGLRRSKKGLT